MVTKLVFHAIMSIQIEILPCFDIFRWGNIEFPLPFGRVMTPSEQMVHQMDEKVRT